MSTDVARQVGVWRQTRALLYKNYLVKWRTKKTSMQEVLIPLSLLSLLTIISVIQPNKRQDEVPDSVLHSENRSSISEFIIGYTPVNNETRRIMHNAFSESCMEDAREFVSEKEMEDARNLHSSEKFVGIIFKDSMTYHLRVPPKLVPVSSIHMCEATVYWHSGFSALQICLDAGIIQSRTNHSILGELESTKAVMMGRSATVEIDYFFRAVILIYLVIAFSPFGYYLTIHIVTEKEKKMKEFLIIMGLQDMAFWYVILLVLC
uniref:Uncharacterized protein n=1 Tax=Varanus komodoensis TaxID=61221 RepID=A0A8D2L3H4_VARKO